ncbi:MAG TPA: DUF2948 family protein [Alphaproteobacteria bacterium]|nr:DUF2948 family protein [Alphaproteobacteria bacterium]
MTTGLPAAYRPLKLRARDEEDLRVLSAHLQDAIVPIVDVAFTAAERRFVMVVNRFKWEAGAQPADQSLGSDEADEEAESRPVYLRTNCGIRVEGVSAVRSKGIDFRDRSLILDLLALRYGDGILHMDFAGGAAIAVTVDRIDIRMEDVGEAWPTTKRPEHRFEEGDATA